MAGKSTNDQETLRAVQAIVLDIAKAFAEVCEKNGFRYSLFLGSLLGAVRHKGIIPWDDDIDFVMPRKDFDLFLEVAGRDLPKRYQLKCFQFDNSERYLARIEDTETLLKLDSYREGNELPVWLDVFVLDGTKSCAFGRSVHYFDLLCKKGLWAISAFDKVVNLNRPGRPAYQQAIIDFCKVVNPGRFFDTRKRLEKLDDASSRIDYDRAEYIFCSSTAYAFKKVTWLRSDFDKLAKYAFEDVYFPGPVNYDAVFSATYGNYMELPPEEKRTIHHINLVRCPISYLKTACGDGIADA